MRTNPECDVPTPIYHKRVVCDNCGRVVSEERVDAATFDRLVQQQDPDDEDLLTEEYERPVQVLVTRVSSCRRCADTR